MGRVAGRQGKPNRLHAMQRNFKMQLGFMAFSINSFTFVLFLLCFRPGFHNYSHWRHPEVQHGSLASDLRSPELLLRRLNIQEEVTLSFSFLNRIYVQKWLHKCCVEQPRDEEFQVF